MLDRDAISRTGLPTWVPGRETKAEGWVNAAAKNSAAVHGIVNPNTVDKILSSGSIAKTGLPTEVSGKGREAAGWVSEGAKNSAAVHGIVNPNVVDAILSPESIAKTGLPTQVFTYVYVNMYVLVYKYMMCVYVCV
jgi:hypothetical protein